MKPITEEPRKSCTECGTFFAGKGRQKYCTNTCNWRAKERRKVEAGYYQQPHVKQRQADCKRAQYRRDVQSGKADGSRLAIWSERGAASLADLPTVCVVADCERDVFARLKCKAHYEREMRMSGRAWAAYSPISGNDYRARAEKFGVLYEDFDKYEVYARDGWICGICSEPVDHNLGYPDPESVSLDHIIPLSRGGGHTASNTQCSHLSCNVRKGARHGEEVRTGAGLTGDERAKVC